MMMVVSGRWSWVVMMMMVVGIVVWVVMVVGGDDGVDNKGRW